jgi:MoaA/NifB/PqqE/SkfB family radical SAM enzyme
MTDCILPTVHIATERNGNYLPCCGTIAKGIPSKDGYYNISKHSIVEVWSSEYYKKLRNDLKNGIKHPDCIRCWTSEDLGMTSRRQNSNATYNFIPSNYPVDLDIKIGNTCNLKCITCNQVASSQVEKEVNVWKAQGIKLPAVLDFIDKEYTGEKLTVENIDTVDDNLKESLFVSKHISLQGGEPFASPLTFKILDFCIDNNLTDKTISVTSNLTSLDKRLLSRLEKFTRCSIQASWDHIDADKFNYIRYPANYNHFQKNLHLLLSHSKIVSGVSFTVSIFNIFDIDKIFAEFDNAFATVECPSFAMQIANDPNYFNVSYLETEQKIKILEILSNITGMFSRNTFVNEKIENLKILLKTNPSDFETVCKERTRVLDLYDTTRNTDYKKLFPYIKRYV